jgi:hypothetical protein
MYWVKIHENVTKIDSLEKNLIENRQFSQFADLVKWDYIGYQPSYFSNGA